MPAFSVMPNMSPEGRLTRISGVSGRAPSGPAALVTHIVDIGTRIIVESVQ